MKELSIKKLYYSISEVSKMTSIKPYVLRYWETEFTQLHPSKNRAGKRIYRQSDIQLVLLIKRFLYIDKFTIEGARQQLRKLNNETKIEKTDLNERRAKIIKDLKHTLLEVRDIIGA